MKESISGTWTVSLVATFTLLFISFLCVMISYNKCFRMKNDIINIIEKYDGFNEESKQIIDNYLISRNYKNNGNCTIEEAKRYTINNGNGVYCVSEKKEYGTYLVNFEIEIFYSIDLPIVNTFTNFSVSGTTTNINPSKSTKDFWKYERVFNK